MMLEETATVLEVEDGLLTVQTISRSSCSRCSSSGCSTSVISRLFGLKRNRLVMENRLGARPGDRVVIGITDATLVRASIWAYLFPLAGMLSMTGISVFAGAGDLLQVLCALFGLTTGFYLVNGLTSSQRQRRQFTPVLLRIEGRSSANFGLTELIDF